MLTPAVGCGSGCATGSGSARGRRPTSRTCDSIPAELVATDGVSEAEVARLPRRLLAGKGKPAHSLEMITALFDVPYDDFISIVLARPTLQAEIEADVAAKMDEAFPPHETAQEVADEAIAAAENDPKGTMLVQALRAMRGLVEREPLRRGAAKTVAEDGPGSAALRKRAVDDARTDLERLRKLRQDYEDANQYGAPAVPGISAEEQARQKLSLDSAVETAATELRTAEELQAAAVLARRARTRNQRRTRQLNASVAETRREAKRQAARTPYERINLQGISAAERRAARATREAVAAEDWAEAAASVERHLFYHFLYRASRNEIDASKVILGRMRKYEKPRVLARINRAGAEHLEQILDILDRFNLRSTRNRPKGSTGSKQTLVEFRDDIEQNEGGTVFVPPDFGQTAKPWRELTPDALREVDRLVANIAHLAGEKNKLTALEKALELEEARAMVRDTLAITQQNQRGFAEADPTDPTMLEVVAEKRHKAAALLQKPEFLFVDLDGGKFGGAIWRLLFEPVQRAADARGTMGRDYAHAFDALMKQHGVKLSKWSTERWSVPGIKKKITRKTMLAVALNMGNRDNFLKMREGGLGIDLPFTDAQVTGILSRMTQDDVDFVQGVWDLFETLWDPIAELERRTNGIIPDRVEAEEVHWTLEDGTKVTSAGGYYPIMLDPRRGTIMQNAKDIETIRNSTGGRRAMTRHSHTLLRTKSHGIPIRFDLDVIPQHMNDVILDLTHREAVQQVQKLLKDKGTKEDPGVAISLRKVIGADMLEQLNDWIVAVATEDRKPLTDAEKLFGQLRRGASIFAMGWKVSTGVAQFLGAFTTKDELSNKGKHGFKYMNAARRQWFNGVIHENTQVPYTEFIHARSVQMQTRRQNFDRDVREVLQNIKKPAGQLSVERSYFYFIALADDAVSKMSWMAAYSQAMAGDTNGIELTDPNLEKNAILYADQIVRTSQGTGMSKDLAAIQRGELHRSLTMFYSYFSVLYNITASRTRQSRGNRLKNMPQLAASFMYLYFLPAIVGELLSNRLPDDDDPEDWLGWAAAETFEYLASPIPGLRNAASALASGYDVEFFPIERFAGAAVGAAGAISEAVADVSADPLDARFLKDVTAVAVIGSGGLGKVPITRQVQITLEGLYDSIVEDDYELRDIMRWALPGNPDRR